MSFLDKLDLAAPTELDRYQIAFSLYVAREIIEADGRLDTGELRLLSATFTDEILRAVGFIDEGGMFTGDLEKYQAGAAAGLAEGLDLAAKLDLVSFFHEACLSGHDVHQDELDVLRDAAVLLGLSPEQVDNHLN